MKTAFPVSQLRLVSLQTVLISCLSVVGFTVLTALCAHAKIYLPFTPVPITLQSMAVVLSGAVLGANKGLVSQVLLILLGWVGLPVFSSNLEGAQVIFGSTGGYILGFMLCAYVSGLLKERGALKKFGLSTFALFVASFFIFVPGVIWLKAMLGISWSAALAMGLYPFIVGDILKTLASSSVIWTLAKIKRP